MEKQPWKNKVQEIFQTCQDELKKTTQIGKKMISASKTNHSLHETYEQIGRMALQDIRSGKLKWDNSKLAELIERIEDCERDLEQIEGEVNKIRFSAGPYDIRSEKKEDSDLT